MNLKLRGGALVCLLGPNGAGKSTLLRTLAGLHPPLDGHVLLSGQPIESFTPRQRAMRMAVVLTDRSGLGALTGAELVRLGRHPYTPWTGRLSRQDHLAIDDAIAAVGGGNLAHRPLAELSDGERQKMLLARALAQSTNLLLLDEVTAFLDVPRRLEMFRILRRLAHRDGKAILLTTHDIDLALHNADRLWLLDAGGIRRGAPESLMLDGSLGRTFAAPGVEVDSLTGAFRLPSRQRRHISLKAQGLAGHWTARALERLGFRVERGLEPADKKPSNPNRFEGTKGSDSAKSVGTVIVTGQDTPHWQLRSQPDRSSAPALERDFEALEDLLDCLAEQIH